MAKTLLPYLRQLILKDDILSFELLYAIFLISCYINYDSMTPEKYHVAFCSLTHNW